MGNNFWKAVTTMIIWAAMSVISLAALAFSQYSFNLFTLLIVIFPLIIALGGTMSIWDTLHPKTAAEEPKQQYEKSKRSEIDKYTLLMQMMDEDEREAFKYSLKERLLDEATYGDGELGSLEELLSEKKFRR